MQCIIMLCLSLVSHVPCPQRGDFSNTNRVRESEEKTECKQPLLTEKNLQLKTNQFF